MRTLSTLALAVVLALFGSACALTSKADAMTIRYFAPERTPPQLTSASTAPVPRPSGRPLRMGRITAGAHLRERIVYRDSDYELGFYEDRRWTERPEVYVRRELARALFDEGMFSRIVGGSAPTLDVEVLSFEELKLARGHFARVALRVILHDDDKVLYEETLTVDRPSPSDDPTALAAAMADALTATAETVAKKAALAVPR